ncbi:MAG: hypothetical protein H0W62_13345 [Chitinophagales bacterium]|nr:hypothetical protein [Chitinophagales bacterium]
MRSLQILLFVCAIHSVYAQNKEGSETANEIKWNKDYKLSYCNFQSAIPENTPWAGLTSSKIFFSYETVNGKISAYTVYASFEPGRSWIKIDTSSVLHHEQLHFDITELYARKLYAEMKSKAGQLTASKSKEIFSGINKEWGKTQEQYDEETAHGIVSEAQEQWVAKIQLLLEQYGPYPESQ